MKKLLLAASLLLMTSFVNAQYLVSATEIGNRSISQVHSILADYGYDPETMDLNGVISYKITYITTDVFGASTIASGALFVPQIECDTLPLVSWNHGTIFERIWVPSNNHANEFGLLYSGNGYIATLPDYLGLGDNPGLHPYVHWESEATASIDLIRAAREFLNDSSPQIWDNNQLFLAGYSQGGHSAMAVHKYIETNNLQNEFNIVASAPASGVYPLYDVQLPMMLEEDSSYYGSQLLPYAIGSYQLVYGNLYTNNNEYYDPPYDSIIADWLNSGIHWGGEWAELIPDNFYDFMVDSVLDNMQNKPDHPFNIDLRANDLHNWIPQKPVRMLYCGMDSLVFPENSIMALDTMIALGATDVQAINLDPNADHFGCIIPAMIYSLEWFESLRNDSCVIVGISALSDTKQPEINLYPNPVKDIATFSSEEIASTEIYDMMGSFIFRQNGNKVDMSALISGVYFVIGMDKDNVPLYKGRVVKY